MAYADYAYYQEVYGGITVSEADFPKLMNQASRYIDVSTGNRAKSATGETLENVKTAACALTEIFLDEENTYAASYSEDSLASGLSSESVGGWSRSYQTKAASAADTQIMDKRKRDTLLLWLGDTGLLRARSYYARGCCGC